MSMNVIPDLTVISSLLTPLHGCSMGKEEVEVKRFDEVFSSLVSAIIRHRVFVKLDTQGYDLKVFKGATGCIGSIDRIQSEISAIPLYAAMPQYTEALAACEGPPCV